MSERMQHLQVVLTEVVAAWAKGVRRSAERAKERRILLISSRLKAAGKLRRGCQDGKLQTKHQRTRQGKEGNTGRIKHHLVELGIKDSIAHIRHCNATYFLLLIEDWRNKLCSLGQ